MEDGPPLFHLSSIILPFTTAYKLEIKLHERIHIISLLELKQYIFFCFEPKRSPAVGCCQQQPALFSRFGNFTAFQPFNLRCIATHALAIVKTLRSLRNTRITSLNKNRNR